MMASILSTLDAEKYEATCFALESIPVDPSLLVSHTLPIAIISAHDGQDPKGENKLLHTLDRGKVDALVVVGLDIWHYNRILPEIQKIVNRKRIPWIPIFPYDIQDVRKDWIDMINMSTHPCVYSKYGERELKPFVPNIRYFRPPLQFADVWRRLDPDERKNARKRYFPTVTDDQILFGFIGANQIRKDPQKIIRAYSILKKEIPNMIMYLHTNLQGVFDLQRYSLDCGLRTNDLVARPPGVQVNAQGMLDIYNSIDCMVNASYQEGLSWTLVEAMLCGTPFIATDTTAQTELLENAGYSIPCQDDCYQPLASTEGRTWIEAKCANIKDIVNAMRDITTKPELRDKLSAQGLEEGKKWLEGVSDINQVLHEALSGSVEVVSSKKKAVLFAQHSSAGDVFMTTRCFKGIKDRYNLPLYYMTSPQYMDIIQGNPHIEDVLEWNESIYSVFEFVLNPHRDRIAPGHWGRNCNSLLSDFYWKLLEVEPTDFFIQRKKPEFLSYNSKYGLGIWTKDDKGVLKMRRSTKNPIAVVHTTGGDPYFRTYKYMADVSNGLRKRGYFVIQLGGVADFPANPDLDLKGGVSWKENAWVMAKASIAVTVDSFLSHLAGALGVSQVCLFGSGNHIVVRPNQMDGELICLSPDYLKYCPGLGPCSGAIRDCPVPCTGRHSPVDIIKAIDKIRTGEKR
jgi:glycosyltransferase involved in cell wall biosynthesis